jgi:hypothetical protein
MLTSKGDQGDAGVNLVARDTWSSLVTYAVNDLVPYSGSAWRCLQSNTNHPPAENTYWTLFIERGTPGAQGPQGVPGNDGVMELQSYIIQAGVRTYNYTMTSSSVGFAFLDGMFLRPGADYDWTSTQITLDSALYIKQDMILNVFFTVPLDRTYVLSKGNVEAVLQGNITTHSHTFDRVNGIKIDVGTTPPSNPQQNDLWVDTSI